MRLSRRAAAVRESATLGLFAELARLRAAGKDVVGLLEGESDLAAPAPVAAAAARSLARGEARYSASAGLPELRAALARKLAAENGVRVAASSVLVTHGAKQAVYEALQTLCSPGDDAVIVSPCWVSFPEAARLAGARPVMVENLGPKLDVDAVGRALTRRARAIVINSPNNPTGAVYGKDELRALCALARKRDMFIVSDEAYEKLVYDGRAHVSPASLAPRNVLTVQTFSKSFAMTGYRVGYLAGPETVLRAAARIHGHVTGNVAVFAQRAALAALALGPAHARRLRETYQKRRDLAYALATPLFDCVKPRGGFFVFCDARRYGLPSAMLVEKLLQRGVAAVPGGACGAEGYVRFSFSGGEANLREGFRRVREALA